MIIEGNYDFDSAPWPQISKHAKDLIRWMLRVDPSQRPSAAEVLQHAWSVQHPKTSVLL